MMDRDPEQLSLLFLCALLERFDRDTLATLSGAPNHILDQVLNIPEIVPLAGYKEIFSVQGNLRESLRTRLRREHPLEELDWLSRVFRYYHVRLPHQIDAEKRSEVEDRCFSFLDQLFTFLYLRLEWQSIREYLSLARAISPIERRHEQALQLYEGFVAIRTGDYANGGLAIATLLSENDLETPTHLNALLALGQMQRNLTRYDEALAVYERLLNLALQTGNTVFHGVALVNMGSVHHELERYDRALDLVLASLQIFVKAQDFERSAYAHYSAGLNAMFLGRWEFAREHYGEAASLFDALQMKTTSATSYWGKGFLDHLLGNEEASEIAYLRTIDIITSSLGGEPIVAMDTWLHLGMLYYFQDRYDESLESYQRAHEIATQLQYNHRISILHYQRGRVHAAAGRPDEALAAYRAAIGSVEALSAAMGREDVKISLLGTTQQIYEAIVLLLFDRGEHAEALHFVERARSRAFLDTLARKSPELLDALAEPVVSLAEIQSRLPVGALLLEYFTTGVLPRGEHLINQIPASNARLREQLVQPPRTLLFAVSRESFATHELVLDPNRLRPQVGERFPGRYLLHGRLPDWLYAQLLGPVAPLLESCATLYLVPHGPLHYVPFGALRAPNGEPLLRAGGPALAQAPSATILLRTCLGRPASQATRALAIGYNDPDGEEPLRFAEAEALHIAALVGGDAWAGPEPKSEQLVAAGPGIRWLHIAGHARFDPDDPLGSSLLLGQGDQLSARTMIAGLELGADLVTLSSCHSGVTHVVPGDELLGIQRALLHSGAPTVVCTRWEANDLVAFLVMDHFYQRLREGVSPAVALHGAQVAVRTLTLGELMERFKHLSSFYPAGVFQLDVLLGMAARSGEPLPPELVVAIEQHQDDLAGTESLCPFDDPLLWAPFMLIGRA